MTAGEEAILCAIKSVTTTGEIVPLSSLIGRMSSATKSDLENWVGSATDIMVAQFLLLMLHGKKKARELITAMNTEEFRKAQIAVQAAAEMPRRGA